MNNNNNQIWRNAHEHVELGFLEHLMAWMTDATSPGVALCLESGNREIASSALVLSFYFNLDGILNARNSCPQRNHQNWKTKQTKRMQHNKESKTIRADQGGIEPTQKALVKAVDVLESYTLSKWQLVLLHIFSPLDYTRRAYYIYNSFVVAVGCSS